MNRGAIFDLDGTLLDSMRVWEQVDIDFLAEHGIAAPQDYTRAVAEMSLADSAAYTVRRFALPLSPEEVMGRWRAMVQQAYETEVPLKPGQRRCCKGCTGQAGVWAWPRRWKEHSTSPACGGWESMNGFAPLPR